MEKFRLVQPLRALPGPVAMQQQGSVSTSMAQITTRNHGDVPDLGSYLEPYTYPRAMQNWPCLPLAVVHSIAGPRSHQQQHLRKQALYLEAQVSQPKGMSVGELAPPPICCEVA